MSQSLCEARTQETNPEPSADTSPPGPSESLATATDARWGEHIRSRTGFGSGSGFGSYRRSLWGLNLVSLILGEDPQ